MSGTSDQSSLVVDLGNLEVFDNRPLDLVESGKQADPYCTEVCQSAVQHLFGKLFQLPTTSSPEGVFVSLPEPSLAVPREKPLPSRKLPTRWETFARRKGIQNRKRSRKVWSETADDWRPRFGYKSDRHTADQANWAVEHKPGMEDPFGEGSQKRRKMMKKQVVNQARNLKKADKMTTLGLGPVSTLSKPVSRKEHLSGALKTSEVSTASVGKFSRTTGSKFKKSKTLAVRDGNRPAGRDSSLRILDSMFPKDNVVTDVSKAVGKELGDRRKKGKVSGSGKRIQGKSGTRVGGYKKRMKPK